MSNLSRFIDRLLSTDDSAGALALFAASLSLLYSGAGRYSVDSMLVRRMIWVAPSAGFTLARGAR